MGKKEWFVSHHLILLSQGLSLNHLARLANSDSQ